MQQYSQYSISTIKMIRNNNIAGENTNLADYNTYFMLDYFDLLFHRNLTGENKIYREFWGIRDNQEKEGFSYEAACKTLSLYAKSKTIEEDVFKISIDPAEDFLSACPFLGVIQINIVYYIYQKQPKAGNILQHCENHILHELKKKGFVPGHEMKYQLFRSSTSGDFCLAVRSSSIEDIFKISSLINNLSFKLNGEIYKFNTYTNLGIECFKNKKKHFVSFRNDTIDKNKNCKFALRITTDNCFAKKCSK